MVLFLDRVVIGILVHKMIDEETFNQKVVEEKHDMLFRDINLVFMTIIWHQHCIVVVSSICIYARCKLERNVVMELVYSSIAINEVTVYPCLEVKVLRRVLHNPLV